MNTSKEEQFLSLIATHQGIINKVVHLYADTTEDINDLRQEVLLQAWKGYARFADRSSFSTWLYRVSLNTALSFRKSYKSSEELRHDHEISIDEPTGEREQLYHVIKQLNEVDKMLITLHLDGFKNPEIAEITGLTTNHINVKLHRIKTEIISQLKKIA